VSHRETSLARVSTTIRAIERRDGNQRTALDGAIDEPAQRIGDDRRSFAATIDIRGPRRSLKAFDPAIDIPFACARVSSWLARFGLTRRYR